MVHDRCHCDRVDLIYALSTSVQVDDSSSVFGVLGTLTCTRQSDQHSSVEIKGSFSAA